MEGVAILTLGVIGVCFCFYYYWNRTSLPPKAQLLITLWNAVDSPKKGSANEETINCN